MLLLKIKTNNLEAIKNTKARDTKRRPILGSLQKKQNTKAACNRSTMHTRHDLVSVRDFERKSSGSIHKAHTNICGRLLYQKRV